ncbi:GntR family transcriptional regulator [Streptosporangiaceae bacterium NEAU-GS5]|nr:GntR family transcriptional regulator [Streptosporangiaceae bacterium NEAU-GS5]
MANSDPVYLRVVEDLRRQIIDGSLPPGAPIPSRHQITRKYGVGETAARHALRVLAGEGLIIGRVGSGHRVRERPILIPLQRGRASDHHSLFATDIQAGGIRATWHWRSGPVDAPPDIARRLKLPDWEQVVRTNYVLRGDGRPLQLATSYEQAGFTEGLETEEGSGERRSFVNRIASYGVKITEVTESVYVRVPQPIESDLLELPTGIQLLHIERTHYAGDRPVETSDVLIPGDRFQLVYTIPPPG